MTNKFQFDAVIFDLDGVVTQTALVHGTAWKKMFDDYLKSREERFGEPFREFTHADDYLPYVDGKPRYKGVASFLESRGIDIPFGDPSDSVDMETACGLGNKKNVFFNAVLEEEGVKVYDSTVKLLEELKTAGVHIGVASSSKNCKPVLEASNLLHYFETRIDGVVSAEIGLNGKPEPDIFTTACDRLGVEYSKAIVVEDAVSGVQAGKKGNFGLVIGLAREENIRELQIAGGDIVVEDLSELSMEDLNNWFIQGIEDDSWHLDYHDYIFEKERSREALLTVGNGYFGTRGALEESIANKVNYPGTYVTGLFNRRTSKVGGKDIENEDFVNISNWLPVRFRIKGEDWAGFNPESGMHLEKIHRRLDMKRGILEKEMIVSDDLERKTLIRSERFAGMHNEHLAGIRYIIKPLNYSGEIEIESEISGDHINAGVERYKDLNQEHLEPVSENIQNGIMELEVKTTQSDIHIAMAAINSISGIDAGSVTRHADVDTSSIRESFELQVDKGQKIVLTKLVCLYTSMKNDSLSPMEDARTTLQTLSGFEQELEKSVNSWKDIWDDVDIKIEGDRAARKLIHLHTYHMLVTASPHHAKYDSGIPPRGLHGEAYRGHIFWDELYILPFYNLHFPEVSKSTLMYRYRRLDEARKYAKEYSYEGAMFPWQSGSDGREETQVLHLNPLSGEWGDDYSSLQRHISLAVAYNTWNYYHECNDIEFMADFGNELFFDICKFWISKTAYDESDGRYHIDKVMGPDEFHEKLPGSNVGGLKDNAYTNIMVSWMLGKAAELLETYKGKGIETTLEKIGVTEEDLNKWEKVRKKLALNIDKEGIIEHFAGYFELEELDWEGYEKKYGNIHRMDRILKAEGKSPDSFKLSKQADLLMAFYNIGEAGVSRIISDLGYSVPADYMKKNFDYYIARTSHGSTLSRLVHARLAFCLGAFAVGWNLYREALESDLVDIQGGTTGEGIHCGVMAGTVSDAMKAFAGLDLSGELPVIKPNMPAPWKELGFNFSFKGFQFQVDISETEIKISRTDTEKVEIKTHICDKEYQILPGQPLIVKRN